MAKMNKKLPLSESRKFILSDETPFSIREAYRKAGTGLAFSLAENKPKTVVITSCSPSEGKSTSCLNIAISMAETGASVLLIDCDLRKPVQDSLLCLGNDVGLSSVIGGLVHDVSDVINRNVRPNLDVLTSGPVPPNPAELIAGARMDSLLKLVGSQYDYVFIDTPPANVVTDAFLMNARIAGIVFVVREGRTKHYDIRECLRKAGMANAHVLGFVKAYCSVRK